MKKLFVLALTAVMMAGCEYIRYSNGFGPEYTHKGNCKFCQERREKELRELLRETVWLIKEGDSNE